MATNEAPVVFTPKHILVTGGAGFIASHVAIRLVKNYPQYKVGSGTGKCIMKRTRLVWGGAVALPWFEKEKVSRRSVGCFGAAQVVVFDKLDYCASLNNLNSVDQLPNFKVCCWQSSIGSTQSYAC
jgi:UDP-glucose 4,6-dehydratase